jgi:hypothetical protein
MRQIFSFGLLGLVVLTGCQSPTRSDLTQLQRMDASADLRANASEQISCNARDSVCVRLLVLRGNACIKLTEAPDVATRASSRTCALDDFGTAQRLLPDASSAEDRRKVLTGLAEAQKIVRDSSAPGAAAGSNEALATTAVTLRALTGSAAYGAYYAADANVFRAQRAEPIAEACRQLAEARQGLPADPLPADLGSRVRLLRLTIDAASRPPARTCR